MDKLKSFFISHWLLIIIIIIASLLRLYNITQLPPGFYPDEAIYANNGVETWETGNFKVFYPENNGREGLWPNIIGFFIINFGYEPWVPRVMAAIFGILTVLGVYFLTRELFRENPKSEARNPKQYQNSNVQNSKRFRILDFGNWNLFRISNLEFRISRGDAIALLSSFFIATSFWHILFSRIGFRAIMAPTFLVWGIYFLLKSLRNTNQYEFTKSYIRRNSYFVNAILGGIFFGLGFHTYIAYRAMPLLILMIFLLYWFNNKEWQIRKKIIYLTAIFLFFTFIVALPIGIHFLQNPQDFFGRTGQISIFNSPTLFKDLGMNILKTAGMFNFSGDWNWRHNYAGKPQLFWPIGILFLTGIFYGLRGLFKKEYSQSFIILFSWLIIAVLPTVISNEGLPHALRALLMIPPVFILAGFGGVWLYDKLTNNLRLTTYNKKYKLLLVISYLLLVIFIFEAYYSYFIRWGKNPNVQDAFSANYVQMGRELNALPKELPKYVIVEAQGVDVRGIPMPAQTIMFITDTFTPEKQRVKNIYYVLPKQAEQIPENSYKIILR